MAKVKTLFLDIGGVLLTDGWNRTARANAYKQFELEADSEEIDNRHGMNFDTYELDLTTLDQYLDNTIFYKKRSFSKDDFIAYMLKQSKPLPGAIEYFTELKRANGLKVFAVSNEARDLNTYRIKKFKLDQLFDAFISSCYVGMRKPDPSIYKLAADVSNTPFREAVYVDDRLPYIEFAKTLGLPAFQYTGIDSAKKYFIKAGLK